jgi:hypothetical protein
MLACEHSPPLFILREAWASSCRAATGAWFFYKSHTSLLRCVDAVHAGGIMAVCYWGQEVEKRGPWQQLMALTTATRPQVWHLGIASLLSGLYQSGLTLRIRSPLTC